jgi:hypothetical protein
VLLFVLPMWMNFLLRTFAWQTHSGEQRRHQQRTDLSRDEAASSDQHARRDRLRYGVQLSAVHGAANLQRLIKISPDVFEAAQEISGRERGRRSAK